MSDKKGAYGKIFLLQRNIHRTACAQNCPALNPSCTAKSQADMTLVRARILSQLSNTRSCGCLWEILPAGAGAAEGVCARLCEMEF